MSSNQTFDNSKLAATSAQTNQTQQRQGSNSPTNSAEISAHNLAPSQMREHVGPPEITHDYPEDSTHRRHSSVTHQQAHYMK